MSVRPKRTRRDANHAKIVAQARALGIVVWDTADLGGEILDTVMCWRGFCLPVEIKAPGKRSKLTKGERSGIAGLAAVGVEAVIAEGVEDIVAAFDMIVEFEGGVERW